MVSIRSYVDTLIPCCPTAGWRVHWHRKGPGYWHRRGCSAL